MSQLLTSVRWNSYSKTTVSPTRGRYDFESFLKLPSILSIPYPQVLVQSYEFAWAVFFNNKFKSEILTRRKEALLIIKIYGDNHYQIEQAAHSYCLLILSGHRYLTHITAAQIRLELRIAILLIFHSLPTKRLYVWRVISEKSLVSLK